MGGSVLMKCVEWMEFMICVKWVERMKSIKCVEWMAWMKLWNARNGWDGMRGRGYMYDRGGMGGMDGMD